MSVLIKGMEMINYCYECPFHKNIHNERWCNQLNRVVGGDDGHSPNDCPLVYVPTPHGRLIDADELKRNTMFIFSGTIREKEIDEATTIIEAEVEN